MDVSINELSDWTGRDRRTITKRLEKLQYTIGPKSAHLYDSAAALASIYQVDSVGKSLDDARTELALEQAALARVNRENAEKKRPPLDLVLTLLDEIGQATASTLKASKGKTLTEATINAIFAQFRELPSKLVW